MFYAGFFSFVRITSLMRLSFELLPKSGFHKSLRSYFEEHARLDEWTVLKRRIYDREGRTCWICGDTRKLKAHAFWDFRGGKQILVGVHHLCDLCHKVKHMRFWASGRGQKLLEQEGLKTSDLMDHFFIVNECTIEEFEQHREDVFEEYKERCQEEWKLDLSWLENN